MSQLRSTKKQIVRALTGQFLNKSVTKRAELILSAATIQKSFPSNPLKHRAFAARVKAMKSRKS